MMPPTGNKSVHPQALVAVMLRRQKIAIAGAVLSMMTAVLAATLLVGSEARLVDVVTIFAAGFGAGASVMVLARSVSRA
jgi:hypothetical protein